MKTARLLIASIAVMLSATAPPAHAQESVDLVQAFEDAVNALATDGGQIPFVWEQLPDSAGVTDGENDLFTLFGGEPTFRPGYLDLLESSQFGFTLPRDAFQALFGEDGVLDCARPEVSCPLYDTTARPFADGVFVVGFRLAAPPEPSRREALTLAVLANDDDFPTFQDPRPFSPFVDTNDAWRLDLTAEADAVAFLQVVSGPYEEFHTDARVLLHGDLAWFLIPPSEFPVRGTITGVRAHTFAVPQPNAGINAQVADVDGPANAPALTTPVGQSGELRLSPPPEEPVSPPPSPVQESPPAESPAGGGTAGSEAASSDLINWVLIAVGIIAAIVGFLLFGGWIWGTKEDEKPAAPGYGPTRERPKKEDIGPPGPGHTTGRTSPPPPASTPPPTPTEYAACDWAVYYVTDAGRELLRPAKGRECCVYTISVFLSVDRLDQAARGRQEGVTPDAPNARLRIPSFTLEPHGLGARVEAAVRSGPAEDLGWMQGLGLPSQPTAVAPYRQSRSHEEPPEVSAHVAWVIANVVKVNLESMCPGHVNRYTALAAGNIASNADLECTYQGPPECPVEFTAAGWVQGKVDIDIEYDMKHQLGSDPDELEPVAPEGTPFHAITDLHDHERRDRLHHEAAEIAGDEASKQDDYLWLVFHTGLVAEAATIVPESAWPATGRITALVGSTVEHGATIAAEMERVDCLSGPCCGLTACECAPALQLRFAGPLGVIEVDGTSYRITPDPGPVGTGRAWTLG